MQRPDPSPFDVLEAAFRLLTSGPEPVSLDGRAVGHGLPARPINLGELRGLLLDPSVGFPARDAAVARLARQARDHGGAATVGLAGVLLPGLRRGTIPLARACPGKAADVEAAVLAGLVEAIAAFDDTTARPAASLVWAAVRAGHRLLGSERAWRTRHQPRGLPAEPPRPAGHPDFVLAQAVADGVLTRVEAEVIGESRIGGVKLTVLAAAQGVPYEQLKRFRQRAEVRLVRWLLFDRLSQEGAGGRVSRVRGRAGDGRRPGATGGFLAKEVTSAPARPAAAVPPPPHLAARSKLKRSLPCPEPAARACWSAPAPWPWSWWSWRQARRWRRPPTRPCRG